MLARWEPFRELARVLDDPFFRVWQGDGGEARWTPAVDIREDEKEFLVKADLPGVDPKDVEINVKNETLTIQGSRKFEKEDKGEGYHRIERSYGSFCRSFSLPSTIASDKVEAEYKNGVLMVHIPKREEVKPRKIEVKES